MAASGGRLRRAALAVSRVVAACLLASGCATQADSTPSAQAPSASAPSASQPATSPSAVPTTDPSIVVVSAFANIFAAGHDRTPSPGGGGGGSLPPEWPLPSGATRIVTFPTVTGEVYGRIGQAPSNGPGGEELIDTDVESFGGISGIVHGSKAMFLVGVFLTDDPPADPAPERLDFTDNEDFDLLEPEIGQTFLIGDGIARRYLVPAGATRLFLGFAEGMLYKGPPGWYRNNSGELEAKVEMSID